MKPETQEWVDKAEGDWGTMLRESDVVIDPNYDAVCFHAQQCAEKYLKAKLFDADIPFRKTHDLLNLLGSVLTVEPEWTIYEDLLSKLSVFGVAGRYPGLVSNELQAREAVQNCSDIRSVVRESLKLSDL